MRGQLSVKELMQEFPLKKLILVSGQCLDPGKKRLKKDFDIVRITEKSWELLGSRNGNWLKKVRSDNKGASDSEEVIASTYYKGASDSEVIAATYKETFVFEEYGQGSMTVRLFYKGDKGFLKDWKFISPKLKKYLAKIN